MSILDVLSTAVKPINPLNEKGETMKYKLGMKGRDKITGFEGILISHVKYLTGCDQYGLAPPAKDGKDENSHYFDEGRIEIIGEGVTTEEVKSKQNGGPNRDCPQ